MECNGQKWRQSVPLVTTMDEVLGPQYTQEPCCRCLRKEYGVDVVLGVFVVKKLMVSGTV